MIITKRTILAVCAALVLLGAVLFAPNLLELGRRHLHGVKRGVRLEGQLVEGLLECELYDVVASLAESAEIEPSNASCDWQTGIITPEVVGQVVDVPATIVQLLKAPARAELTLELVEIIPSITSAYFQPYYQGSDSEPRVSLMVNVDWGDEFIPGMLDVFEQYNVSATWFPTGRWVRQTTELAKAIAAAGHELGNHGGWHGMPAQMSREELSRLIREGEDEIFQATGQKPRLFAPPSGDFNRQTVHVAAELGYKTVLWTVDTVDWQRPAPTVIIDRVLSKIGNGSLVLMHPTQPTLEALPIIIDALKEQGYQFVTVSELLSD